MALFILTWRWFFGRLYMLPVHSGDLRLVPSAVRHDNGTMATGSAAYNSIVYKACQPPFFYAPIAATLQKHSSCICMRKSYN